MKKQYINPSMDIVKTRPYVLSVTSPNGTGAVDTTTTAQDPDSFDSRNVFGFEDEDE